MVSVVVATEVASRFGLLDGTTVAVPVAARNCTVVEPVVTFTQPAAELTVKTRPATALTEVRVPEAGLTVRPVPATGATTVTAILVTAAAPVPVKADACLTVMVPVEPVPVAVLHVTVDAVAVSSRGLFVCAERGPAVKMSGSIAAKIFPPCVFKTFMSISGPSFS